MSAFLIAVLILFGIVLIILEILIVPGFIVGIAGALFVVMGIGWTWQVYGSTAGISVAILSAVISGLSIWSALRTSFWKRFSLTDQLEGKMNVIDTSLVKTGDRGAAVSSLRPMGTVKVNGIKFEATTEGQMVPPNYPVVVVSVEGNKIIVKADQ